MKKFLLYLFCVFLLVLCLFACKKDDDDNTPAVVPTLLSANVDILEYYVDNKITFPLKMKINLKNTGNGTIKNLEFNVYVKTKAGKEGKLTMVTSSFELLEGEDIELILTSIQNVPASNIHFVSNDRNSTTINGYSLDEILDEVTLVEGSVILS